MNVARVALLMLLGAALQAQGAGVKEPRAEVQVGLCAPEKAIESALALKPREASYETWLFDTPALALLDRGVRVRLRSKAGASELTVKVANQDCPALPRTLLPRGKGKCEYDVYGTQRNGVVSLTRKLDDASARALVSSSLPVAQVLSEAQKRFLREVVRVDPLPPDIRALGPISNRVYATPDGALDVDMSQLPGGQRYAEISTKVPLQQADATLAKVEAQVRAAGIAMCADQGGQSAAKMRLMLK